MVAAILTDQFLSLDTADRSAVKADALAEICFIAPTVES